MTSGPRQRCAWRIDDPLMLAYHDTEWGVPVHDDVRLFELLVLEAFQAGLSWSGVLRKRENFRRALDGFDPARIAGYTPPDVERLLADSGIIRNHLKIMATINNAQRFVELQTEFGSFDEYVWRFVGGQPIRNRFQSMFELPSKSQEAEALSQDLRRRGFKFVGPIICYAFMQAMGMVNDHTIDCFRHGEINETEEP